MMKMNHYAKAIACSVLCGLIVGGCIIGSFAIGRKISSSPSSSSEDGAYTVTQLAKECGSSVVMISTKSVSEVESFFGTYQQEDKSAGSGVIVSQSDTELLIVTNNHVVEGAEEVSVCFNDSVDAIYTAQVKGTNPDNDLAVVSVALSDLSEDVLNSFSVAVFGDPESPQVGDNVAVIGNPLGLGKSVTSGIISAVDRKVTDDDGSVTGTSGSNTRTVTLLQTDAAVNPGNSGGALFNQNGELIGIVSSKYARVDIEGMGFAIPMDVVQPIIEYLTEEPTEGYGSLNIAVTTVTSDMKKNYGDLPDGVYVIQVNEGGAADKAGIKKGDVITAINGKSVKIFEALINEVRDCAAGETVEITVQRDSGSGYEEQTFTVTLDDTLELDTSSSDSSSDSVQD